MTRRRWYGLLAGICGLGAAMAASGNLLYIPAIIVWAGFYLWYTARHPEKVANK